MGCDATLMHFVLYILYLNAYYARSSHVERTISTDTEEFYFWKSNIILFYTHDCMLYDATYRDVVF